MSFPLVLTKSVPISEAITPIAAIAKGTVTPLSENPAATASAIVEVPGILVNGKNSLEPTANATVESTQASLVTVGQIDFAVSINAIVEVPGILVSNENAYEASTNAQVTSSEAAIDVGNALEFLVSSFATMDASDFDLLVRYIMRNPDGTNGGVIQNTDGSYGGTIRTWDGGSWI